MKKNSERRRKLQKIIFISKLYLIRKLEPSDIMKFIQEMKNKVNTLDIFEIYHDFCSKFGNFDENKNETETNKIK